LFGQIKPAQVIVTGEMSPDDLDKRDEKPETRGINAALNIQAGGTIGATATVRVRLIQSSPASDPELVRKTEELAREFNERVREPEGAPIDFDPELESPWVVEERAKSST
jgi:hypothetical protein